MGELQFVFVHGLSGWGSYDEAYVRMPYWGMRGGDLMVFLREQGYACYAASVAPSGSAWDRACELWAQIAGTRVDYGKAHSARFGHERLGRDFSGMALLPEWNEGTRIVLLGHSFGGATIRLFSELLAHGDREEQEACAGEKMSPLFAGGMENRVHAVVTLASPMNGTTAYDLFEDRAFHPEQVSVPLWSRWAARLMSAGLRKKEQNRDRGDTAAADMHIDRAVKLNDRMQVLPKVWYFSVPCSFTRKLPDGTWRPEKGMEPLFVMRACQIGAYAGRTAGGMEIDGSWRENDGLVNTCSAAWPLGAPHRMMDDNPPKPGMWNVYPTFRGDHMALQGGLTRKHDIRRFYRDMLQMISSLP